MRPIDEMGVPLFIIWAIGAVALIFFVFREEITWLWKRILQKFRR